MYMFRVHVTYITVWDYNKHLSLRLQNHACFNRQISSGSVLSDLSYVVNRHYSGFSATWAFIATWLDVPAYVNISVCSRAWVAIDFLNRRTVSRRMTDY